MSGYEDVWMHVSPDTHGRRLTLAVPPDQIVDVVAQLRAIAAVADDPIAATRIRRMLMQLRGQDDEVVLRAMPADILLVLEWGLRSAREDLELELERDRPALAYAEAAFERIRWYLRALAEIETLELAAAGLTPEDVRHPGAPVYALSVGRSADGTDGSLAAARAS